jgi:hypothetical protein
MTITPLAGTDETQSSWRDLISLQNIRIEVLISCDLLIFAELNPDWIDWVLSGLRDGLESGKLFVACRNYVISRHSRRAIFEYGGEDIVSVWFCTIGGMSSEPKMMRASDDVINHHVWMLANTESPLLFRSLSQKLDAVLYRVSAITITHINPINYKCAKDGAGF